MFAIFETGGKQYRVSEGDEIFVEKLASDEKTITFNSVVAVISDDDIKTGSPYLKNAEVAAEIIKTGKAKKIIVYKMKPKKNYRRKYGHRQPYTKLKIISISGG